jgi:hypothetical protein
MGPKHMKRTGHDPPPRPPSTRPKALEFKACGPLTHPEYNFGPPPYLNPSTSSSSDLFSISGASVDEDTQRTTDGSKCGGNNDVVSHAVAEESADVEMQRANGDGSGDSGRGDSSLQVSNNPNVHERGEPSSSETSTLIDERLTSSMTVSFIHALLLIKAILTHLLIIYPVQHCHDLVKMLHESISSMTVTNPLPLTP